MAGECESTRLHDEDPLGRLLNSFQHIVAKEVDLLHDMGSSEFFLIDGESLVLEHSSWHGSRRADCSTPLSVVFAVERLLVDLKSAGSSQFAVAFFGGYQGAWRARNSAAWTTRQLVEAHLRGIGMPVVSFEDWWSEASQIPGSGDGELQAKKCQTVARSYEVYSDCSFSSYLAIHRPAFVLVSDAFVAQYMDRDACLSLPSCGVPALTLGLIYRCLSAGSDCAYMSNLSFDGITVHGYLTSAEKSTGQVYKVQGSATQDALEVMRSSIAAASSPFQHNAETSTGEKLSPDGLLSMLKCQGSWRLAAGVWSCARALELLAYEPDPPDSTMLWLADAWLLHLALLRAIPLTCRAFQTVPPGSDLAMAWPGGSISSFMAAVLEAMSMAFCAAQQSILPGLLVGKVPPTTWTCHMDRWQPSMPAELSDSFDCRLFCMLLATLYGLQPGAGTTAAGTTGGSAASLGLPYPVQNEWDAARKQLRCSLRELQQDPLVGNIGPMPPQVAKALEQHYGPAHTLAKMWAPPLEPQHPPMLSRPRSNLEEDSFCGRVLQQCGDRAARLDGNGAVLDLLGAAPLFIMTQPFVERYHWHVKEELVPAFYAEATDEVESMKKLVKEVDSLPLAELTTKRYIRYKVRDMISRLLDQASRAVTGEERAALHQEAVNQARKAAKEFVLRQSTMTTRAMHRMVESLQGTKFIASTTRPGSTGVTSTHRQGTSGGLGQKAALIREKNDQQKMLQLLQEEQKKWKTTVEDKLLLWCGQDEGVWKNVDDIKKYALACVDSFLKGVKTLQMKQVALGTRVLLIYKAVVEAHRTSPAGQKQKMRTTEAWGTWLLRELLLTIQQIKALGAHALLPPSLLSVSAARGSLAAEDNQSGGPATKNMKERAVAMNEGPKSIKQSKKPKQDKTRNQPGSDSAVPTHIKVPWKERTTTTALGATMACLCSLGFDAIAQQLAQELCIEWGCGRKLDGKAHKGGKVKGRGETRLAAGSSQKEASRMDPMDPMSWQLTEALSSLAAVAAAVKLKSNVITRVCPVRFQLQHMSHLLERPAGGAKDPRVDGFTPDEWQKQLLDAVDAGSSAVVSAPTSSGKTFIGSYVIARVLSEGPTGRVVIVLPTKALVNQMAAQVHKDFGHLSGSEGYGQVYGIFTRDFRANVLSSRVLITVPACLEILVLSPANMNWVQSIRYTILDEVHCMNERGSGEVWERLMLAMRCPLLALSATIGNPHNFTTWLRRVKALQYVQDIAAGHVTSAGTQAPPQYQVQLIVHEERYNDLKYQVYTPFYNLEATGGEDKTTQSMCQPVWKVPGCTGVDSACMSGDRAAGAIVPLHPIGSVDLEEVASCLDNTAGYVLSMAPDEALELYDLMCCEASSWQQEDLSGQQLAIQLQSLEPGAFLGPLPDLVTDVSLLPSDREPVTDMDGSSVQASASSLSSGARAVVTPVKMEPHTYSRAALLTRPAAKHWARQLTSHMVEWYRAGPRGRQALIQVRNRLCAAPEHGVKAYEASWAAGPDQSKSPHSLTAQLQHLMMLLMELSRTDKLPAILFNFDRSGCMAYADRLVSELEKAESMYRTRYADKLEALREEREIQKLRALAAADAAERRKAKGMERGHDEVLGGATSHHLSVPFAVLDGITFSLDESVPDPSFTFLAPDKMSSNLLMETIEDLRYVMDNDMGQKLLAALARGIGVHHSGLHTRYRQAVEMLFRSKVLQVVVATGTLAYGIHMPCKAVVMAGDSVFLDALNFRQMSGRAGRRGLDTLGHVVFYHVPLHKIHRLRAAPLPRLRGQFSLTPTLTLRLMLMSQRQRQRLNKKGASAARQISKASESTQQIAGCLGPAAEDLMSCIIREPFLREAIGITAARTQPTSLEAAARNMSVGEKQSLAIQAAVGHLEVAEQQPFDFKVASRDSNGLGGDLMDRHTGFLEDCIQQQFLHSFSMSVRHLADFGLVNSGGQACGLAGLASHLYWTEPANFVLVRLLASGALHALLEELKSPQDRMETLGLVVAHLFAHKSLHPAYVAALRLRAKGQSPSVVILSDMPGPCQLVVDEYNAKVLDTACRCVVQYAVTLQASTSERDRTRVAAMEAEACTLPLSSIAHYAPHGKLPAITALHWRGERPQGMGQVAPYGALTTTDIPPELHDRPTLGQLFLADNSPLRLSPISAASPFCCLVGHGDDFTNVQELVSCTKPYIHVSPRAIPVLELRDRHGQKWPLNAYVVDYLKHGQRKAIVRDNMISEGDAWEALRAVQGILAATALSLDLLVEGGNGEELERRHLDTIPRHKRLGEEQLLSPRHTEEICSFHEDDQRSQRSHHSGTSSSSARVRVKSEISSESQFIHRDKHQSHIQHISDAFRELSTSFTDKFRRFNT